MRSWLVLVVVAGCLDASSDPIEPQVTSGVIQKRIPIAISRRIDVLFVIDNSPAMAVHADTVRANLARFVDVLRAQPNGVPDLRLGVTTTDLGGAGCTTNDGGTLRGTTGLTGNFVVDFVGPDGVRLRNYDGDLAGVLARLTDVGTQGCAQAQPLAAARRALENPANRGFLRADAYTAVFFITATDAPDELSALDGYERFWKTLHPDPTNVLFGAVLGDGERIPAFLDRFPNRNTRAAITSPDWSQVFTVLGGLLKTTLGVPCIEGPLLDVDPVTPGPQYECAAWYEFPVGGEVIPACRDTLAGPCWKIVEDRAVCPDTEGILKLEQPRVDLPERVMLNLDCLSR